MHIRSSALSDSYKDVRNLPILQIPEVLRNKDSNLVFQPHHRLARKNFIVQTGPRVFTLSMTPPSVSWSDFLPELLAVFGKVGEAGVVSGVSRFGLRYINKFDGLVLNRLNVDLKILGRDVQQDQVYIRNTFTSGAFQVLLQIANFSDEIADGDGNEAKIESAIDTDVSRKEEGLDFFANMEQILNDAHQIQEEIFFGLLTEEFLTSMNPEY